MIHKFIFILSVLIFTSAAVAEKSGEPHHHHHMGHGTLNVDDSETAPQISLNVFPDAMSGWNIEIKTKNFEFAPNLASQSHVNGKGHGHLYIDEVKIGRVYSNWIHLNNLSPGEHRVRVSLNTNDHQDYAVNGKVIDSEIVIIKK